MPGYNWPTSLASSVTVDTVTSRNALAAAGTVPAGGLVYVTTTQCLYQLGNDLATWSFFLPSPALAKQANWAIDIATGSDNNSGLPGSPLATTEELSRRLCPGFQVCALQQTTTVTIAAGAYGRLDLNVDWPSGTGLFGKFLSIQCAYTSTANMTLSAVTNTTNGSVRGQLTVSSGSLTAKRRIRSTSGAQVGAICYSTGQNANAQNHFVSAWFSYNSSGNINIVNGTTLAVDTLAVSIKIVNIQNTGQGYCEFRDCQQTGPWSFPLANDQVQVGTFLVACELNGNIDGIFEAQQCRTTGNVTSACSIILGCAWDGCSIQNTLTLIGYQSLGSEGSNCVDGGKLVFSFGIFLMVTACEFENGIAGTALAVKNISFLQMRAGVLLWGLSASWSIGITADSLCGLVAVAAANLAIPAIQQMQLSGQNFSYADVPICLPETGAKVTLASDASAISTTGGAVALTAAARGNVGATNIFSSNPRRGMYRVQAYLAITVAGTLGVPLVQVSYTDDSGVVQTDTIPFLNGLNVTTLGGSGGEVIIETDGASQMQYSVIGVTTQGNLQYSLRVNARIESPG